MPTARRSIPMPALTPAALAPYMGQVMLGGAGGFGLGGGAYRERAFVSGLDNRITSLWGDVQARRSRYEVLWGHFEGNVYRHVHRYAEGLKEDHQLYKYIRPIYNPTYRLVEFYAQHLMGGAIDPAAGDGKLIPSALPIVAENDAIRPMIGQIWRNSQWPGHKDTWTRYGVAMGDAPLMVIDDEAAQKVRLKPIHPRQIRHLRRDDYGNVTCYVLEEVRFHPDGDMAAPIPRMALYTEICERVGTSVVFTTFLDNEIHDWRDYPDGTPESRMTGGSWTEPYGFVPLVMAQHRDMGFGWGFAEMHPSLPKLHELDDVASKLDDAVRIAVETQWFFTGITGADVSFRDDAADEDGDRDGEQSGRTTLNTLTALDPAAKAFPLVAPIDIAATSAHVQTIIEEIERDHPELSRDLAGSNASGRARRIAREHVEAMVSQRRAGYDDALVRAQMMALSIGGIKGYPGFEGIDDGSYLRGDLDHAIGDRPVFTVDEMDRLEERKARADLLKVLIDSGVPLPQAMEEAGYPAELIAAAERGQADAQTQAMDRQRAMFSGAGQDGVAA